jgi:hypothetical protein
MNHAYKGARNIFNCWHTKEIPNCRYVYDLPPYIFQMPNLNSLLSKVIKLEATYITFHNFFFRSVPMPHINIPYKVTSPLHKFTRLPCIGYCYTRSYRHYEVPVTTNNITSKKSWKSVKVFRIWKEGHTHTRHDITVLQLFFHYKRIQIKHTITRKK